MSTIRDRIIDGIVAALNTTTPVGVPNVVRTLMSPNETSQLPMVTVFPYREEVDENATGRWGPIVKRQLFLRFVAYATGDPADQALDPIVEWLSTIGGSQVNGLANDVVEHELTWQYDEGNYEVAAVAMDFRIDYQTLRGDATKTQ